MSHCSTDHSEDENCCESENNHGSSRGEEACTMAEDLVCLAKSAQKELLREKMEKLLEAKIGKQLDQVAEAAVDALLANWQQKVAEKHACDHYKEQLMAAFKG